MKSIHTILKKYASLLYLGAAALLLVVATVSLLSVSHKGVGADNFVELSYKAQSPIGDVGGTTVPASCESGTTNWNDNGGYHIDGVTSKPANIGAACSYTLTNDGQCGVDLVNTGTTVAGDTSCTAACTTTTPTLPDARCNDSIVKISLSNTEIAYNGSYKLSYDAKYVLKNSCTLQITDGGGTGPETPVAQSFNFGTVSGNLGPNIKKWTLSCRSPKTGAVVTDTATLRVKSECESIRCVVDAIDPKTPGPSTDPTLPKPVPCPNTPGVYKTATGGYVVVDAACVSTPITIGEVCIDPISKKAAVCNPVPPTLVPDMTIAPEIESFTSVPKLVRENALATLSWAISNIPAAGCKVYDITDPATVLRTVTTSTSYTTTGLPGVYTGKLGVGPITKKTTYRMDCGVNKTKDTTISIYRFNEF